MSRLFYHVMQDNAGNLLFDVSGTMRLAGTGTAATIYGDEALTIPIANPMTNHPSFGSFKCFLGAGDYDFYMAKSGYTFETLTGVQGHGTMAQQNASGVAITGGTLIGLGQVDITGSPGTLYVGGTTRLNGTVGIAQAPTASIPLGITYNKVNQYGIVLTPLNTDTGTQAMLFKNIATADVGSISTSATATAYNTASDGRLKKDVTALPGALAVVQALRPVRFKWKSDESEGRGFLASEVEDVLPDGGVITGARDAVDAEGNILPQQIDPGKLVVWLVGACKELAAQVETLTARLDAAGA